MDNARTWGLGNSHLKLKISKGDAAFEVSSFGQRSCDRVCPKTKNLELAVNLCVNKWNGQTSLQLMLVDARVDGVQLFNIRSKNATLPDKVPVLRFTEELPDLSNSKSVVVYDLPDDLQVLKKILQSQDFEAIYFKNEIAKPYYLTGYGNREQFAKLYKTIYQFPDLMYAISSRT